MSGNGNGHGPNGTGPKPAGWAPPPKEIVVRPAITAEYAQSRAAFEAREDALRAAKVAVTKSVGRAAIRWRGEFREPVELRMLAEQLEGLRQDFVREAGVIETQRKKDSARKETP
jgi:hypothetical protein